MTADKQTDLLGKRAARLDFQAVILAGGLGTRMRPITETVPKPMIPVCGKPFLQHQLELLRSHGFSRVLLLVSYLGEKIEQHFGAGATLGLALNYSYESSPLGTGGALKNAADKLEAEFVVLNGDTFLPIDYAALVADFRKHRPVSALIVAQERPNLKNNLAISADGHVEAYRKRDPEGMTHTDAGVIVLGREVLSEMFVESGRAGELPASPRFCSLEEEVFPRLIESGRMRAWVTHEPFFDMGSPEGLQALTARLA